MITIRTGQTRRLFGAENSQRHAPLGNDEYQIERQAMARLAGNQARSAEAAALPPGTFSPASREFPYVAKYTVNFATAQATELWVPIAGYAVSFFDSTNLTDIVNVRFAVTQGDVAGQPLPFRPGHALGIGDFTWLGLTWAQIVGATGTLAILPRGVLLDENH